MKAVVCKAPGALAVVERPRPVRASGDVLVRIRRIGLCGTDYHIFRGDQPYLEYPRIMGHELAGEVLEAPDDGGLRPGQVVTVNPYLACGACIACRRGKPNCCAAIRVLGVHTDGGMCEFLSLPASAVIPADGLTLDQAAMVEFLSVGAHAVARGEVGEGQRVLVMGAGPIGLGVALFTSFAGAQVTLADTSAARLARARAISGIADVVPVETDFIAQLSARTDGEFYDVVLDATGNPHAMEAGFAYVAHGGTYVLVSVVKQDIRFSDPEFHKREMRLLGSRNALRSDFERVIAAIRDGHVPTAAIRTHELPLADAPRRIPELIVDQGAVMKAIVTV